MARRFELPSASNGSALRALAFTQGMVTEALR
jgi:hypothetical protein